jgi:hypothetical protein
MFSRRRTDPDGRSLPASLKEISCGHEITVHPEGNAMNLRFFLVRGEKGIPVSGLIHAQLERNGDLGICIIFPDPSLHPLHHGSGSENQ